MHRMLRTGVPVGLCLFACIGLASAQANHGACQGLETAAPGLYGLCIAVCEAHGCEPDFNQLDPFAGCSPSDPTLVDRYEALRGSADPPLPCVVEEGGCPCFTQEMVDAIPTPYSQCIIDYQFQPGSDYFSTNIFHGIQAPGEMRIAAQATVGPFDGSCAYGDNFVDPEIFIFLQTNLTQAQECRQIVVNTINANIDQCELLCDPVCN